MSRLYDPEPQPGDGPEYHADHQYWVERGVDRRPAVPKGQYIQVSKEVLENTIQVPASALITGATIRTSPDGQVIGSDPVNHPAHYNNGPKCECGRVIECIDITRHYNLLRGTAMKYLWRADHKGKKIEDLKKSLWYIQKEIDVLEKENEQS